MPGRAVVPGRHAELRRARAGGGGDPSRRRRGRRARSQTRAPRGAHVVGAGRRGGAVPRRAGAPRRRTGRPGRRVPAEHPRDADRVPGHREPRRDLVVVRARVRRPFGRRPLRADRAGRAASRSTATATARRPSTSAPRSRRSRLRCPRCGTRCTCAYLGDGDRRLDGRCSPSPARSRSIRSPFDHPLYVLYSSGTTGLPKAIVHGHGGITVEHLKSAALHHDLGAGDRFFWFTTTGWMMWNYLMSGLLVGATIVLFDGDPGVPDLGDALAARGGHRRRRVRRQRPVPHGLPQGRRRAARAPSPQASARPARRCPPDGFRWVHDVVGADVQVQSVSGGTDVCAAFVGRGAAAAGAGRRDQLPAARASRWRRSIPTATCARRACRASWSSPSRCRRCRSGSGAISEQEKLRHAYFSDYPGVWRHGDWITFTDDGACVISGRSDATLNRGGVRLGTSDFYAVVEGLPEVADSLVVHLEGDDPDRPMGELLLFVALVAGRGARRRPPRVDRARAAHRAVAAPRAGRDPRGARGAAHALGQEARGAGQADPRTGRTPTPSPAAARSPTRLRSTGTRSSRRRGRRTGRTEALIPTGARSRNLRDVRSARAGTVAVPVDRA